MICSRCGANVPDGINFCIQCGLDLRTQASAPAAQPARPAAAPEAAYSQPQPRPVQTARPMYAAEPHPAAPQPAPHAAPIPQTAIPQRPAAAAPVQAPPPAGNTGTPVPMPQPSGAAQQPPVGQWQQSVPAPGAKPAKKEKQPKVKPEKPAKAPKAPKPVKEKTGKGRGGLIAAFIIALVLALAATAAFLLLYFDVFDFWKNSGSDNKSAAQAADTASLQEKAGAYDVMVDFLAKDEPNVGAKKFYAEVPVIVMNKDDEPVTFRITANLSRGANVTFSAYDNVAKFEWTEESWSKSTDIRVTPVAPGATVITFSNDANDATFEVLVIVKE